VLERSRGARTSEMGFVDDPNFLYEVEQLFVSDGDRTLDLLLAGEDAIRELLLFLPTFRALLRMLMSIDGFLVVELLLNVDCSLTLLRCDTPLLPMERRTTRGALAAYSYHSS
jgi:hypothetical protein